MRLLVLTCLTLGTSLIGAAGAWAAPVNDDFASATEMSALPFSDVVDATTATTEASEPQSCYFSERTVWYKITPSQDGTLAADASRSTAYAQVTAYRADGGGLSGLSFLTCANFGNASAVFKVQEGQTYYVQASSLFGTAGSLHVDVESVLPPSNDDFSNAKTINATPFSSAVDLTAATAESGEPTSCPAGPSPATAWYAFTPSQSGSYLLNRSDHYGPLAAYSGDSLASLTEVSCSHGPLYFHAEAGTTYYLQVSRLGDSGGRLQLTLDMAPDAVASFGFYPGDPSMLDTVQFYDYSYDPAGIHSRKWNIAGASAMECCPTHRYAADGDYPAQLAVTTNDGRKASTSQVVKVRTHDVAITDLTVPTSARVGRTKQITVGVNNSRYPEKVQVSMLRSVAGGGFEEVGQVTQSVPSRASGRRTTFSISYTFAPEDATIGKVTFKAIATILTARDAHPADNDAIARATKVSS